MKKIFLAILLLIAASALLLSAGFREEPTFEEKREIVISELNLAIQDAEREGKYKCCIEPACTMCYLGDWIWDDGTCDCDGMIVNGEWEKVCPQCKSGLEEGTCKSATEEEEACDLGSGERFKPIS